MDDKIIIDRMDAGRISLDAHGRCQAGQPDPLLQCRPDHRKHCQRLQRPLQTVNQGWPIGATGRKEMAMTYLEILGWARKGVIAEKENYRQMQEKALEGQAHDIAGHCQKMIDELDVRLATLDEIEELHNRK